MESPYHSWVGASRASRPKVKTGCVTCKQRRVKCPGEKPTCSRCQKGTRSCEYADPQSDSRPVTKLQVRFQQYSGNPDVVPSVSRFTSEAERRGFEYFQNTSALAIGPGLGSPAWLDLVLQNSEHSLVLRHAAIALGAIHEHELRFSRPRQSVFAQDHRSFAYRQYGEAIRHFRSELPLQFRVTPERIMLVCILFTIFDFVQGDDRAAAAHLKGGLTILRKVATGTGLWNRTISFRGQTEDLDKQASGPMSSSCRMSDSESMQRNLIKTFAYLDFWSLIWADGETLFPEITQIDGLPIEPAYRDEESLHFHLLCFTTLENRIHEFRRTAKARSNRGYNEALAGAFSKTKQDLLDGLSHWHTKLSVLCLSENAGLDNEQKRSVRITELNHLKIRLMLLACQGNGNSDYRAFDLMFQQLVSMARPMIKSTFLPKARSQVFSFIPRLIHPLYITAVRCCRIELCEDAIELLKSVEWIEGAWNSAVMARIARRKLDYRFASKTARGSAAGPCNIMCT